MQSAVGGLSGMTNLAQDGVSFNSTAQDNRGNDSPVKFQGTQSTMQSQGMSKLGSTNASQTTSGVAIMMADLDRIQSEQQTMSRKIEMEKRKALKLDQALLDQREQLQYYRDVTKSGRIVKDDEMLSKKMIQKLEYQVAQARNKLSALRKENQEVKGNVMEFRKEKMFQYGILLELKKEISHNKKIAIDGKEEITIVNNKKQRAEVDLLNQKNKLFVEMDEFGQELNEAKQNVVNTQASILDGIREKFQTTFTPTFDDSPRKKVQDFEPVINTAALEREQKLKEYLKVVGVDSLEDLIVALQKTEEDMFTKYNNIQEITQEAENMEVENKHLEQNLDDELTNLEELEASSGQRVEELEGKINGIYHNIEIYHESFTKNMETLNTTKKELEGIFYNFALDENPRDQALLAAGITWRNIPDFLGQVEQRIDELIQMMKAAKHENLHRDDFAKTPAPITSRTNSRNTEDSQLHNTGGRLQLSNLPSFKDAEDDEDDADADAEKVLPINVGKLKNFMAKKLNNSQAKSKREGELRTPDKQRKSSPHGSGSKGPTTTTTSGDAAGNLPTSPISGDLIANPPDSHMSSAANSLPQTPSGSRPSTTGSGRRAVVHDTRTKNEKMTDMRTRRETLRDPITSVDNGTEIRMGTPTVIAVAPSSR